MCERTGLSQNKLGEKAGIAGGVMSRLANKQKHSAGRPETMRKLAVAHGYRFEWLTDGTGPPRATDVAADGAVAFEAKSAHARERVIEVIVAAGKADAMRWAIDKAREQEQKGATEEDWWAIIKRLHQWREGALAELEQIDASPEGQEDRDTFEPRRKERAVTDTEPAARRRKRRTSGTIDAVRGPGARGPAPIPREEEDETPRTFTRERR